MEENKPHLENLNMSCQVIWRKFKHSCQPDWRKRKETFDRFKL